MSGAATSTRRHPVPPADARGGAAMSGAATSTRRHPVPPADQRAEARR